MKRKYFDRDQLKEMFPNNIAGHISELRFLKVELSEDEQSVYVSLESGEHKDFKTEVNDSDGHVR